MSVMTSASDKRSEEAPCRNEATRPLTADEYISAVRLVKESIETSVRAWAKKWGALYPDEALLELRRLVGDEREDRSLEAQATHYKCLTCSIVVEAHRRYGVCPGQTGTSAEHVWSAIDHRRPEAQPSTAERLQSLGFEKPEPWQMDPFVRPMRIIVDGFAPNGQEPNNHAAYLCVQCQAVVPENAPCPRCAPEWRPCEKCGAATRAKHDHLCQPRSFSAPATPPQAGCADPVTPAIGASPREDVPATAAGKLGSGDGGERPAPYGRSFDRLRDILDEHFGMQPVMPDEEALTFLEKRLFESRRRSDAQPRGYGPLPVRRLAGLVDEIVAATQMSVTMQHWEDCESKREDIPEGERGPCDCSTGIAQAAFWLARNTQQDPWIQEQVIAEGVREGDPLPDPRRAAAAVPDAERDLAAENEELRGRLKNAEDALRARMGER